jgi:hypothetical protein
MARRSFRPIRGSVAVDSGDEYRSDAGCFADEVVIDFPSPARAIDRIRHAFVADERAAIAADLCLSVREAREGATVPLGVPVHCTCQGCGGRGETWPDRCGRCAGSGLEVRRHQVEVSVPAGTCDGDRFHFSVSARHDVSTRIELRVRIA